MDRELHVHFLDDLGVFMQDIQVEDLLKLSGFRADSPRREELSGLLLSLRSRATLMLTRFYSHFTIQYSLRMFINPSPV